MSAADLAARRAAAASVLADYCRELDSAPLSRPPGREWMLRLADVLGDVPAALDAEAGAAVNVGGAAAVPLETERQAQELPAVFAAFDADPGLGKMAPHSLAMLRGAWGLVLLPFVALVWLADRSMRSHSRADLPLPVAQDPDAW